MAVLWDLICPAEVQQCNLQWWALQNRQLSFLHTDNAPSWTSAMWGEGYIMWGGHTEENRGALVSSPICAPCQQHQWPAMDELSWMLFPSRTSADHGPGQRAMQQKNHPSEPSQPIDSGGRLNCCFETLSCAAVDNWSILEVITF